MSLCYAVMQFGADWKIVSEHRRIGHYTEQKCAVLAGARLALEARGAGHEVDFLVQQADGELVRRDPLDFVGTSGPPQAEPCAQVA